MLGHQAIARAIAPIRVATGEMAQNRVIFKAAACRRARSAVQIDACRLGGVNEVLAVLLLAAKFDVPVCPHAGGVGQFLQYVQHLSAFDQIAVAPSLDGRYVGSSPDHLQSIESRRGRERRVPTADRAGLRRRAGSPRARGAPFRRRGLALTAAARIRIGGLGEVGDVRGEALSVRRNDRRRRARARARVTMGRLEEALPRPRDPHPAPDDGLGTSS